MGKARRIFALCLATAMLALGWAATPAQAAGRSLFVGTCNKNGLADLPTAVAAANASPAASRKTITVCPGTYRVLSTLAVTTSNLTITGKPGAVLTVPDGWDWPVITVTGTDRVTIQNLTIRPGAGYAGNLISFTSSTRAAVQKMVLDGQGALGTDSQVAVLLLNTSGKVANNQFLEWHDPDFLREADVIGAGGDGTQTVSVTKNTFTNFTGVPINIANMASVTVTNNKMTGPTPGPRQRVTRGISLFGIGSGRITGNVIDAGTLSPGDLTRGMDLFGVNNLRISGNKVSHWTWGIQLIGGCAPFQSGHNRLTGNTISETGTGISLQSSGANFMCNSSLDNTTVTGNKIVDSAVHGILGIELITASDPGFTADAQNEVVKGNTIIGFAKGLTSPLPDPAHFITGVFGPNTVK